MSTKVISVRVTKKDIYRGQHREAGTSVSTNCAIALALKRHFKTLDAGWGYAQGTVGARKFDALAFQTVRKWVSRHDLGKSVKPFTLRLREVENVN